MNFEAILEAIISGLIIAAILLFHEMWQEKQRKKRKATEKALEWYFSGSVNNIVSEKREKMYHYSRYADDELKELIYNYMRSFDYDGERYAKPEAEAIHDYLDEMAKEKQEKI